MGMAPAEGGEGRGLAALRADVLRGALTLMALAMPVLGAVIVAQHILRGRLDAVTIGLSGYALTFPLLRLLLSRLSFHSAALTFLVLLGWLAFLMQVRGGFTDGSTALHLILIVLSGVLFGRRGAVLALLLALAASGTAAWLVLGGRVPPIDTAMWSALNPEAWIRGAVALGLFGTAAAAAVLYVVHRLEAEARAAMEAAQRMEMLGRMAGGVAHDFNNLLTVILSCSGALVESLRASGHAGAADAEQIQVAGERARDLTRQLLAFARRQPIAPFPLDLNEVIRGSDRLLRRVIGERVELVLDLDPDPWLALCDRSQVEQVLHNLAVNSRDAMPAGGKVTIHTSRAEVPPGAQGGLTVTAPGAYVRLAVRDTGEGMSAEVRERVFEPFFTTKAEGKGTGLGLATVYGIVKQSGGHIHVESQCGCGALFEILLPRAVRAGGAAVAQDARRTAP